MPKKLHSSWAWRNKYTERVARPAVFFLLLLVTFQEGSAATGWERLSELRPGDAITVVQMDRKEYSGEFIRVDAGNLFFRANSGELAIERTRIRRVTLRARSKRLRNALIGGGIGVAVALTVDRTLGTYLNNEAGYEPGARALVWTLPIGIGAGLGTATASHPTIYLAK